MMKKARRYAGGLYAGTEARALAAGAPAPQGSTLFYCRAQGGPSLLNTARLPQRRRSLSAIKYG